MTDVHSTRWRWLREPALHFVLLGAALFGLNQLVKADAPAPADARTIEIGSDVVGSLRVDLERRSGRSPTEAELSAAVQRWLDEEVLYREALALGLDRGDPVIRRRLVQKMAFLSEDLVPVEPPTEAELAAWLADHAEEFRRPERVTLEHVFVGRPGGSGADGAPTRADAVLSELRAGADPGGLGEPFLRGRRFASKTAAELDAVFGVGFAVAVAAFPVGEWAGPVESSYGLHLVRVEERTPARAPALDEVRAAVRRDLVAARRDEANAEAMRQLRAGYEVRFVGGAEPGGASAEVAP